MILFTGPSYKVENLVKVINNENNNSTRIINIIALNGGDNYNFYTTEMKSYQAKRRLVVGKTNSHHI